MPASGCQNAPPTAEAVNAGEGAHKDQMSGDCADKEIQARICSTKRKRQRPAIASTRHPIHTGAGAFRHCNDTQEMDRQQAALSWFLEKGESGPTPPPPSKDRRAPSAGPSRPAARRRRRACAPPPGSARRASARSARRSVIMPPVPAGMSRPTMTFSFRPSSVSTLPLTAASVSTRVVSWNDAAEMNERVCRLALVMPNSTGTPSPVPCSPRAADR